MIDKQEITVKGSNEGFNIGKLPKAVIMSPSINNVKLICATPISTGMEMMNYVNDKAFKFRETLNQGLNKKRPYEAAVVKSMDIIF